ncbi:MAG: hypothetical protein M9934_13525 [Thermomicrobiales bacterium]|nr:hypothetical protein [Thermomicrobiales bacterium]
MNSESAISTSGNLIIMCYQHQRCTLLPHQRYEQIHNLISRLRIQRPRGFIGQQQLRPTRKGACNGHPLLLTAAENIRFLMRPMLKANKLEEVLGTTMSSSPLGIGTEKKRFSNVLSRSLPYYQIELLKNKSQVGTSQR